MSIYRKRRTIHTEHDVRVLDRGGRDAEAPLALDPSTPSVVPLPPSLTGKRLNVEGERSDVVPLRRARDWAASRRASPVEVLLPIARAWVADLPAPLRPRHLVVRFPRVANQIAANWKDEPACRALLRDLIIDRRGDRLGFPRAVHEELMDIACHYHRAGPRGTIDWTG